MDILNEATAGLEKYLCEKADLMKIPLVATFELSPVCNLDCEMCYIRQKSQEVEEQGGLHAKEFWIKKAEEAIKAGTLFVLLTGGEPFLYPDFKELYIALHKLGIYITINTNATLIGEEEIEWLTKYPPRRLNISLYGASNETYFKVCKDKWGFSKVKNAIELLQKNNILIRISHVRTVQNVNDYKKIIQFCNEHHLSLSISNYMFPPARKYCIDLHNGGRLNPEEAGICAFEYAKDKRSESEFNKYLQEVLNISTTKISLQEASPISCRAGTSCFWINWKGEMLPCGIMVEPKICIKSNSIEDGWEYIKSEVEKIRLSKTCSQCSYKEHCMICAAAAQAETGFFDKSPSYLCEMTSSLIKKLHEEAKRRNL